MLRALAAALFVALAMVPQACAQQPFLNDDADVIGLHHWHFETNNEYDFLRNSSFPNLRQDTQTVKFSYGLFGNCEVGMDFPLLVIFNAASSGLGNPFGLGDTDFSIKYNLRKEREGSRWPAVTASLNIEPPTGNSKLQLGSGLIDYYLNGIFQKTLTHKDTLRVNAGASPATHSLVLSVSRREAQSSQVVLRSHTSSRRNWILVSRSMAAIRRISPWVAASCKNKSAGTTKSARD